MRLIKCAHCKETSKSPSRGVQWGVKNKITLETSFWMLVKGTKSGETWASSSWECGGNFLVLGEKKSDFRQQEHCNRRCLCRHLHLFFYIGNMNNRSFRRIKPRIFLKIFLLNGFLHRIFPWTLQRGVYLYNLGLTNSKTNIKVQWVLLLKNFKTLTPKSTILTHTILTCFSHASKELKGKYFPWRRDYVKYRLWLKSLHAEEELAAQGYSLL